MRKIKAESLKTLNQKLDIVRVLEEMGVADIADTHPEVLSTCPFHAGTDVEAVLTVDKKTRTAICDESQCVVASGEPLISVFARATKRSLDDSASYWAGNLGLTLDYDELQPPPPPPPPAPPAPPAPPKVAAPPPSRHDEDTEILEDVEVPAMRPQETAKSETPSGEIDAEDLVLVAEPAVETPLAAPTSATAAAARPVPAPGPSPLHTTKFAAVSDHAPSGPVGADRERDEEAILRYLLGDDPASMLEVASHGISEVDFRGGGSGTPGLSLHGAIFAAIRRAHDRREPADVAALAAGLPEAHRREAFEALEHIGKGTTTDRKRFRQAVRRMADAVLRENLESALRASITDLLTNTTDDPHELLRHASERIESVGRSAAGPLLTQEMAMPEIVESIFDREEVPLATFSDGLNKILNGGLQFGHLTVLTGAPGSGKTAMLLQLADAIAASNGDRQKKGLSPLPVVFVSTSVARRHLALRSLARLTRMNAGALQSKRWISGWEGDFLESEVDINEEVETVAAYYERRVRDAEAAYRAAEAHLAIVEASPWTTVETIRGYVLQALRRFGSRGALLIVDSLHHVIPGSKEGKPAWNDPERLESVGARLKHLAMSLRIPVVASLDASGDRFDQDRPGHILLDSADVVLSLRADEDILAAGNIPRDVKSLPKRAQAFRDILERIREANPLEFSHSEYAVLEPLKHRSGALNATVFIFNKAWHAFEELEP